MSEAEKSKPNQDNDTELESILAKSHNGQCSHGAFYIKPMELKAQIKAHYKQKIEEAIPKKLNARDVAHKEGNTDYWLGLTRGFNYAVDKLRQKLGLEE